MEATYKVLDGKIEFRVQGSTEKEIFRQFAKIAEVFDEKRCGQCKKNNLAFVVRNVQDGKKTYEYFELRCKDCGAKLEFGQLNEGGGLFPKRKLADGSFDKDYLGWGKYTGEGNAKPNSSEKKK